MRRLSPFAGYICILLTAVSFVTARAEDALYPRPRQFKGATPAEVRTWQKESRDFLAKTLFGRAMPDKIDLKITEERIASKGTFDLYRVIYQSTLSRTNYALVSVPKGQGPFPAILALHGHECATDPEAFLREGHVDDFCRYFAQRGFVVVCPDVLNHQLQPEAGFTLIGTWLYDALRCLDYLAARKDVDPDRIASVGLSTGGFLCLYAAALDERIKTAVPAGAYSTMKHDFAHFKCPPGCDCGTSKIEGFRDLDYCDVAGLVAPRALRVMHGKQDPAFYPGTDPKSIVGTSQTAVMNQGDFDAAVAETRKIYQVFGKPELFDVYWHPKGHAVDNPAAFDSIRSRLGITTPLVTLAKVTLDGLFGEFMVLQREQPISIWGRATPGEHLVVTLGNQSVNATADAQGKWRVSFAAMKAGGPYALKAEGDTVARARDVLIGDVWVCGGQSNMRFSMGQALGGKEFLQNTYTNLRVCPMDGPIRSRPILDAPPGTWAIAGPGAPACSAVAQAFGRELQAHLGVPIGLIVCAANSTPIESWMPNEAFSSDPELKYILAEMDKAISNQCAELDAMPAKFEAWRKEADQRERAGQTVEGPPSWGKGDPRQSIFRPAVLFNGCIAPLTQLPIKGVIWYQGESNGSMADEYRRELPALIQGWRAAWKQPDLPFLIVQLPTFRPQRVETNGCTWAELREAQLMTWQKVKNTGMAVTIDLGVDPKDPSQDPLHPPNKIPMGQRLALTARAVAYGENLVYSGPIYKAMKVEGGKVRLAFSHIGGGLLVKGDALNGFTLAGDDKNFLPTTAVVEGSEVVVSCDKVPAPVAVRYNWAYEPTPLGNLYNKEGLPASPFRTDDWPALTTGVKWWF
ncbi:MAG: hypothetical protein PCFJNLEI_00653 [Verrucomicrobiae bacterium]|nr:hypothetical protein [Verrucomicrobiae bacterium]